MSGVPPGIAAGTGALAEISGIVTGGASVLLPAIGSWISSSTIGRGGRNECVVNEHSRWSS